MITFGIRYPDISAIEKATKKYLPLVMENSGALREIQEQMSRTMISMLKRINSLHILFLPDEEQLENFLDKNNERFFLAIGMAWSIGRELADVNPRQARYIALSNAFDGAFLLDSTRVELTDLSDWAKCFLLVALNKANETGQIDDDLVAMELEEMQRVFRESVFLAFKYGVVNYFKGQRSRKNKATEQVFHPSAIPKKRSDSQADWIIQKWSSSPRPKEAERDSKEFIKPLWDKITDLVFMNGNVDTTLARSLGEQMGDILGKTSLLCYYIGYECASTQIGQEVVNGYVLAALDPIGEFVKKLIELLKMTKKINQEKGEILTKEITMTAADCAYGLVMLGIKDYASSEK
jgi:hypothetical protein